MLREYFCAKYLYETAPYCPAGTVKTGTKPERFNAIARDFYWNNVVRFYSGCFDKGEIPMLVDELKDLQNDELLKHTNYPRLLTSQLLSDLMFSQSPKFLKDVVKIIVDDINIGNIINQNCNYYGNDEPILLPDECGRVEIIRECFEQLRHFPRNDHASELIGIIVNNRNEEVLELWNNELKNLSVEKTLQWIEYAYRMQIIHKIDKKILSDIVLQDPNLSSQEQKLQLIVYDNRLDVINQNIKLKQIVLESILSGKILIFPYRKKTDTNLQFLSVLLNPFIVYSIIYEAKDRDYNFIDYTRNRFRFYGFEHEKEEDNYVIGTLPKDDIDVSIDKLYENIDSSLKSNLYEWQNNIEKWDFLIEQLRGIFGDKWSFKILSTVIAGIKDKNLPDKEYFSLSDISISLCKRVKYARTKSGNLNYWKQQFAQNDDLLFVCLVFFTWSTPNVIMKLYDKIQTILNNLSESDIRLLSNSLKRIARCNKLKKTQTKEIMQFQSLPFNITYFISFRFSNEMREEFLYNQNNENSNIFKTEIVKAKFKSLIKNYLKDTDNNDLLTQIKEYYQIFSNCDIDDDCHRYFRFHNDTEFVNIPIEISKNIMKDSKSYPRIIASMAEKSCRLYANENVSIVGKIAIDDKWFD